MPFYTKFHLSSSYIVDDDGDDGDGGGDDEDDDYHHPHRMASEHRYDRADDIECIHHRRLHQH